MNEREAKKVIGLAIEQGRDSVEDLMGLALDINYIHEPVRMTDIKFALDRDHIFLNIPGKTITVNETGLATAIRAMDIPYGLADRLQKSGRLDILIEMLNTFCGRSVHFNAIAHDGERFLSFVNPNHKPSEDEYRLALEAFSVACKAINGAAIDAEKRGLTTVLRGLAIDPIEPINGEMVAAGIRLILSPIGLDVTQVTPIYVRLNGGVPLHMAIIEDARTKLTVNFRTEAHRRRHEFRLAGFWDRVKKAAKRIVVNASKADPIAGIDHLRWKPSQLFRNAASDKILRMYRNPRSMPELTGIWRLAAIIMKVAVTRSRKYMLTQDQVLQMQRFAGKLLYDKKLA